MSTAGRTEADSRDVVGRLREARFVRLVAAPGGDPLVAAGILARTLAARECPFQASVAPPTAETARATDADCTVALGDTDATADVSLAGETEPISQTAAAVARDLGEDPPVALALAGAVADGRVADTRVAATARDAGLERRPGVAVPTDDLADGLAHSTLVHAPFSGDPEAAASALADVGSDETAGRRVASLVVFESVGSEDAPPRAGEAIERALRPFAGSPFGTVGGYADVLDAVARERPGTAVALALGHDVRAAALDAWRAHARRAHAAVAGATTGRYDGLFVSRAPDAPVGTVARLVHDFRSPEPATLAVTDGAAALVADERDPHPVVREAAAAIGGRAGAGPDAAHARFDADASAFVAAVREAR
jgi:hypothetical protein